MNLEKWKKFFSEAGIPSSEASTYAYKFAHNRIQTNMLADLNKDYLKEMGISIMGDVIAVLRHARQVYEDIQKSGKAELPDELKEKRKEKESTAKLPKKLSEPVAAKTETKTMKSGTLKRKSESSNVAIKKKAVEAPKKSKISAVPDLNSDNIEECEDLGYVMIDSSKKALLFNQKLSTHVETRLKSLTIEKQEKPNEMDSDLFNMTEDDDDDDDNVEVIINDPIVTPFGGYKKYAAQQEPNFPPRYKEQLKVLNGHDSIKRTVFKRLGEDISQPSVSSTTPFEDEEQFALTTRKMKEEAAKLVQEKNSVFHRLGQKCDVSSTSIEPVEKLSADEKKTAVKSDLRENIPKSNSISITTANKLNLSRKVKAQQVKGEPEDPDLCLPSCVKSTYTEGILASSGKLRKLSMKERLGCSGSATSLKSPSEADFKIERQRKFASMENLTHREKILPVSSKKRVSFGAVSEKLIPTREEGIRNGELPETATERTSVFDRLGFNRTY